MTVSALIPARGGSKGLPRKNLKELEPGNPASSLLAISIAHARALGAEEVFVSTEDAEIAAAATSAGAQIIERPEALASDLAPTEGVIDHALEYMSGKWIMLLQPTSPLRMVPQIRAQLPEFFAGDYDSGLTVSKAPFIRDRDGNMLGGSRVARQSRPREFAEDGAFYIFSREVVDWPDRVFGRVFLFHAPGMDLDDEVDLEFARAAWNGIDRR